MNYRIYEENITGLVARLEKLNRRAVRIGATPITWTVAGEEFEEVAGKPGLKHRLVILDVVGETPKFNGWMFVGTLNHTEEGNIIRAIPGAEIPVQYRDRRPVCDHCKANRIRRDTYIVRHDDGTHKQVGSNCLHDFLGHADPAKLAAWAELVLGAFDMCASATGGKSGMDIYRIDLPSYLNYVAEQVLRDGRFITRKMANESAILTPTSVLAMNQMTRHDASGLPSEAAIKLATDAREFVLRKYAPHLAETGTDEDFKRSMLGFMSNRNDSLSDFEHNLLVSASCEAIEPKQAGVAAYIIESFRRSQPRPQVAQLDNAGLEVIHKMFTTAKANLKRPAIRLMDEQRHEFQLSLAAETSKNAGCIYVKGEKPTGAYVDADGYGPSRPYLGKITSFGKFFPAQGCPTTVEAQLKAFAADPEGIATKYGRLTGCCCFCGRSLKDARSTEVGFGPVCAKKFGLDWGKMPTAPSVEAPTAVALEPIAA